MLRQYLTAIPIYLALAIGLAGMAAWTVRSGNDLSYYWRDPAAIVNTGPWIGFFSSIGIFLWWIAGAVSVFAALLIRNAHPFRRVAAFLLAFGLFTGFLALDDFFMIHEWVVPTYLPLSEDLMFGVYSVVGTALALLFREEIRSTPVLLLGLAVGCFGLSILTDLVGPDRFLSLGMPPGMLWSLEYVVEDGLKLLGIVAWLHYLALTSFRAVRRAFEPQESGGNGSVSLDHVRERAEVP